MSAAGTWAGRLTCVLHVGMHKTGSTSIQNTLTSTPVAEVTYFPWPGNHGEYLGVAFEERPWELYRAVRTGTPKEVVLEQRAHLRRVLEQRLAHFRQSPKVQKVVLSAERISDHERFVNNTLADLRDALLAHCDKVEVLAYVREPRTFIASNFQQVLRMGGPAALPGGEAWPEYRARFGRFDTVFGPDHVTLLPFDPAVFAGGDVVSDFCTRIGRPIDPADIVRENENIGLEATALLFTLRRAGYAEGLHVMENTTLSLWLGDLFQPLSTRSFRLGESILGPLVADREADIRWMKARLGVPLPGQPDPGGIDCEEELLAIAEGLVERIPALEEPASGRSPMFVKKYPDLTLETIRDWVSEGLRR